MFYTYEEKENGVLVIRATQGYYYTTFVVELFAVPGGLYALSHARAHGDYIQPKPGVATYGLTYHDGEPAEVIALAEKRLANAFDTSRAARLKQGLEERAAFWPKPDPEDPPYLYRRQAGQSDW